jgi:hypothetical protein
MYLEHFVVYVSIRLKFKLYSHDRIICLARNSVFVRPPVLIFADLDVWESVFFLVQHCDNHIFMVNGTESRY